MAPSGRARLFGAVSGISPASGGALSDSGIRASAARQMTRRQNDTIPASSAEGRPPAVLQVIPSLASGGAERGTVEMAAALVDAGWTAYVASSGGPMERQLARAGAQHIKLPLASKNPVVDSAQRRRSETHYPPAPDRHRACAQPRAGMECVVGRARDAPPLCDDIPQRLRYRPAAEALVQFGDGARRAGHRHFAIRRRARRQHLRHRSGPAARDPARRRSRGFRSAPGSRRPRRGAGAAMAGAGRCQDRDAARAIDALEGRARLYRGNSQARPPRSVLLCWSAPSSGPASAANSKP